MVSFRLATGEQSIVEDSRKDDYWGAKMVDDETLCGQNVLGRLLMELREKLRANPGSLRIVEPLTLSEFKLFGDDIPVIFVDAPRSPARAKPEAKATGTPHFWEAPGRP